MSPNPGQPGHATEGFTHVICDVCYFRRARERGWAPVPSRVIDDVTPGDRREYVSARTDEHAWEVE